MVYRQHGIFSIPFPFSVHFLLVGVEKVGGVEGQVESSTNTGTYEMRLQPFLRHHGRNRRREEAHQQLLIQRVRLRAENLTMITCSLSRLAR